MDYLRKFLKLIESILRDTRALALIGFAVIAVLVAWNSVGVLQQNYELEKKISSLKQRNDVAKLENENQKLRNKYYESDEYLELTARRQLGKAKEGEKLYLIPRSLAESSSINVKPIVEDIPEPEIQKNRYQRNIESWIRFFKGESSD
ncbi:MAG: septum formation initiator family protein [Patescibacteria group bacterium]